MKKILAVILVCALFLIGCSNQKTVIKQEEITLAKVKEKIENKESFVFAVSSNECSYCKKLINMLNSYEKEGVFYKIEVTKTSKEDINELLKMYPTLNSTPTTYVYIQGELKETVVGFDATRMKTVLDAFFKK